jgi:glycine/D-amino acid oxidase-like deaminating enzyme
MSRAQQTSERIVVVGGGFAGLSAAVRLTQAGLPVTVLEQSQLGFAASTRNQGWLHSGAWFALRHPLLARQCYDSLLQTLAFAPQCVEPHYGSMIYLSPTDEDEPNDWVNAWEKVGIPYELLRREELVRALPTLRSARDCGCRTGPFDRIHCSLSSRLPPGIPARKFAHRHPPQSYWSMTAKSLA